MKTGKFGSLRDPGFPQLFAVVNVYNQTFPVFSEFVRYLTNKNTSVDIRKIYKIVLRKTKNRDILEKNTEDESHENRIVCYQHLFHGMCSRSTCACTCQNQSQINRKGLLQVENLRQPGVTK